MKKILKLFSSYANNYFCKNYFHTGLSRKLVVQVTLKNKIMINENELASSPLNKPSCDGTRRASMPGHIVVIGGVPVGS